MVYRSCAQTDDYGLASILGMAGSTYHDTYDCNIDDHQFKEI
jgi:hypothetical protein